MKKIALVCGVVLLSVSIHSGFVYGEEVTQDSIDMSLRQEEETTFVDDSQIVYKITGENEVQVGDGEKPIPNLGTLLAVPETVSHNGRNYQVTSIAPFAFTTYEDEAGNISEEGSNVEQLSLPKSLVRIDNKAFYSAIYLRTVTFPNGSQLKSIGDNGFAFSGLTKFDLPDSVETIGVNGFNYNNSLSEFNISENSQLVTIGEGALKTNPKLKRIYLPPHLKELGSAPFSGTINLREIEVSPSNPYFTSVEGVLFDKQVEILVTYPADREGGYYTLPDTTTTINQYGFEYNVNLKELTLNKGLKTIGDFAFKNMLKLESVTLGPEVETIGRLAFFSSHDLTNLIIPDTVTNYGKNPFYDLDGLEKLTLGKETKNIFQGFLGGSLTHLKEIQFNSPDLVIDPNAFAFFSSTNQDNLLYSVVSEEAKAELMTKLSIKEANIQLVKPTEESKDPETSTEPTEESKEPETSTEPTEESKDPETSTEPTEESKNPETSTEPTEESKDPETSTEPTEESKDPETSTEPTKENKERVDRKGVIKKRGSKPDNNQFNNSQVSVVNNEKSNYQLPKTNDTYSANLGLIGMSVLGSIVIYFWKKR